MAYDATTLTRAAENGYFDVVRLLLEHGADLSIREERGRTNQRRSTSGRCLLGNPHSAQGRSRRC